MTDFDADEPVAPLRSHREKDKPKRFWTSDRIIGYSGVALAMSAAFFPWYVFFNGVRSGTHLTASFLARNLPDWAGRGMFKQSPGTTYSEDTATNESAKAREQLEQLVTGAVPDNADATPGDTRDATSQPFPASSLKFHLLHVAKGKALIEAETGIYVVETGSQLPDLSKVTSLEQRDGKWVIVTDKGDIYDTDGKRR